MRQPHRPSYPFQATQQREVSGLFRTSRLTFCCRRFHIQSTSDPSIPPLAQHNSRNEHHAVQGAHGVACTQLPAVRLSGVRSACRVSRSMLQHVADSSSLARRLQSAVPGAHARTALAPTISPSAPADPESLPLCPVCIMLPPKLTHLRISLQDGQPPGPKAQLCRPAAEDSGATLLPLTIAQLHTPQQ